MRRFTVIKGRDFLAKGMSYISCILRYLLNILYLGSCYHNFKIPFTEFTVQKSLRRTLVRLQTWDELIVFVQQNKVYFIHSHAKDVNTFENQQSVRYDHSTIAYETIRSVVGLVMAHRNLYTSAVQEMDLAFGSKNPTDVSWPLQGRSVNFVRIEMEFLLN